MKTTYILVKTQTGKKDAKFHYRICDQEGNLISERRSNREYVAATIDGSFYFGRLDLIGKGDHGRRIKHQIANGWEQTPIAYAENNGY